VGLEGSEEGLHLADLAAAVGIRLVESSIAAFLLLPGKLRDQVYQAETQAPLHFVPVGVHLGEVVARV